MFSHKELGYATRSSLDHLYASEEGYKTWKEQCMSLFMAQYPFSCRERLLRIYYFAWKLIVIPVDMTWYQPYGLWYAVRISSNHLYTSKKGLEALNQQYMWLLMAQYPISHADLVPNMSSFDCNFREFFCYNWQGVNHYNHKGPIYTVRKAFQ